VYLVNYRPARRGREGDWSVCSFTAVGLPALGLRDRTHAVKLETLLESIDVAALSAAPAKKRSKTCQRSE
jgi:hypothetical protein